MVRWRNYSQMGMGHGHGAGLNVLIIFIKEKRAKVDNFSLKNDAKNVQKMTFENNAI